MNPQTQHQTAPAASSGPGNKKRIGIFGSTGSIGRQTLEVIEANADHFSATILTAHSNHELLVEQALKFKPACVVIVDEAKYAEVKNAGYIVSRSI